MSGAVAPGPTVATPVSPPSLQVYFQTHMPPSAAWPARLTQAGSTWNARSGPINSRRATVQPEASRLIWAHLTVTSPVSLFSVTLPLQALPSVRCQAGDFMSPDWSWSASLLKRIEGGNSSQSRTEYTCSGPSQLRQKHGPLEESEWLSIAFG